MDRDSLIARLNAETREERLDALSEIKRLTDMGELRTPEKTGYVNNHIHTIYSFSPYSPAMAIWRAERFSVPLKIICSIKCEMPPSSAGS